MRGRTTVLVVSCLLATSEACLNVTPEFFGTLDASLELESITLPPSGSTCTCCGLCYQRSSCGSFSFHMDSNECILYSTVGQYSTFSRQRRNYHSRQFFIRPGRSQAGEFCRADSDCVDDGLFCRGRMCTDRSVISCRTIYLQNSALPNHRYMGFVDNTDLMLYCRMSTNYEGATLMLSSNYPYSYGQAWTAENVLDKTFEVDEYPNDDTDYSILK